MGHQSGQERRLYVYGTQQKVVAGIAGAETARQPVPALYGDWVLDWRDCAVSHHIDPSEIMAIPGFRVLWSLTDFLFRIYDHVLAFRKREDCAEYQIIGRQRK